MFCQHCGAKIAPEARFCAACGHRVGSGTPIAGQSVTITNPRRGKNLQILGGILVAVGVVIIVLSCGPAMAGGEGSGPASGGLALGGLIFLVGAGISAAGKFQHWYHAE